MRKIGVVIIISILLITNGILLWQTYTLRNSLRAVVGEDAYLTPFNGQIKDFRGIYTFPTIGKYVMPLERQSEPAAPLSLAIFMSAKTSCTMSLSEIEVFKRLLPGFQEKGQFMVAVCTPEDSLAISKFLDSVALPIEVAAVESEQFSFRQMGISPDFMPFKVFYDSTYTAIYMRGANNTPESQVEFEETAMRLSSLAAEGAL